jgi:hypothetical protein
MRVSSKLLATAAFVAASALATVQAHAVTILNVGPGSTTTQFSGTPATAGTGAGGVAGSSPFDDVFSFTVTTHGVISGTVSSPFNSANGQTQNLVFRSAEITGGTLGGPLLFVFSSNGAGLDAHGDLGGTPPPTVNTPIGPGTYTMELKGDNVGNAVSSYTGVLNYLSLGNGVPEPATWAMLITGFGLLGLAARRRHSLGAAKA